ncbi:MAG TPA: PilZ domain-containing protein [Rhabdaerophilum sp.]|nr:PilZ domain-containing protein [Rhabdaerophilum sp.]
MSQSMVEERRQAFRRRALMSGTLRFKARNGSLSCVIRNLSATGAKLAADRAWWIPTQFELEIPHQDIRIDARVVWRDDREMGIAFEAPRNKAARSVHVEERVNNLQAERDALARRVRRFTEEL